MIIFKTITINWTPLKLSEGPEFCTIILPFDAALRRTCLETEKTSYISFLVMAIAELYFSGVIRAKEIFIDMLCAPICGFLTHLVHPRQVDYVVRLQHVFVLE